MSKSTRQLIYLFSLLTAIIFIVLAIIYDKEDKLIFYGIVTEVYPASALVVPLEDFGYDVLSANITGVEIGDKVKIYAHPQVLETHPPIIKVIKYENKSR